MIERTAYICLYFKPHSGTLFIRVTAQVLIDNPSAVSFHSFLVHLCSPSASPVFTLTAFSIASLNQPCQVYKYNDKFGSGFGGTLRRHSENIATVHNNLVEYYFFFIGIRGQSVLWLVGCLCFQL